MDGNTQGTRSFSMNHKNNTRFLKPFLLSDNCFKPITLALDLDKNKPKTLIWAVAYSDHSRLVGHLTRSCGQLGTSGQKVFSTISQIILLSY